VAQARGEEASSLGRAVQENARRLFALDLGAAG
jgi:hypothetical protein